MHYKKNSAWRCGIFVASTLLTLSSTRPSPTGSSHRCFWRGQTLRLDARPRKWWPRHAGGVVLGIAMMVARALAEARWRRRNGRAGGVLDVVVDDVRAAAAHGAGQPAARLWAACRR